MSTTRVRTAVIFFLILAAFLVGGIWLPWLPVVYFTIVAIIGSLELYHALLNKFRPLSLVSIVIGSLTMLSPLVIWYTYRDLRNWHRLPANSLPLDTAWTSDFIWLLAFGVLVFFLVFLVYAFLNVTIKILAKGVDHLPHGVAEVSASFYLAVPLSLVSLFLFALPNGYFWLIFALVSPMIVDVSAYYSGSLLGKKKMLPKISPHKTWVGFFGGILGCILFGILFFMIFMRGETPLVALLPSVLWGALSGLVIGVVAQFGDWVASALKRWCQIKDFSNLLPGHGGILDRFDSILFSLPATLIVALLFYLAKR